jgi:hypothetical protein
VKGLQSDDLMKQIWIPIVFMVGALSQSGCMISSMIADSGAKYSGLKTEEEFTKRFGEPVHVSRFVPPRKVKTTREYLRHRDDLRWDEEDGIDRVASRMCVYRHVGPFYDYQRGVPYMMGSAMTFTLGEPWMIYEATKRQVEMRDDENFLSVFFSPDGCRIVSEERDLSK